MVVLQAPIYPYTGLRLRLRLRFRLRLRLRAHGSGSGSGSGSCLSQSADEIKSASPPSISTPSKIASVSTPSDGRQHKPSQADFTSTSTDRKPPRIGQSAAMHSPRAARVPSSKRRRARR